jgi:hypothetical protein
MTITIENPRNLLLYMRIGELSEWELVPGGNTLVPAGQLRELSLDGITSLGVLASKPVNRGGTWSKFSSPILPQERKLIAPEIYLGGK